MKLRARLAAITALAAILLPLSAALCASPALAQNSAHAADSPVAVSWGVRPTSATGDNSRSSFAFSVKPGVEIDDYLGVSNQGTTETTFQTYAADATNDLKRGGFSLKPSSVKAVDLGSWIHFRSATVTVAPGQEARIPVTIVVPSDAHPGDHTAGIIASIFRASTKSEGKQVRVEERVAVRVYLHVAGAVAASVVANGVTSTFEPSLNPFSGGQTTVNYSIKNSGNVRVDVSQHLNISGLFGLPLGQIEGTLVTNLLPGQSVQQHISAPGIFPALLVWSNLSLTTRAPTDTVTAATTLTDGGVVAAPATAPTYSSFTAESVTAAIPWGLLLLLCILIAAIWLVTRYLAATRDRVYLAIDAAAAEARASALAERLAGAELATTQGSAL